MSRAYRIRVRESVRQIVRGSDRVVTQLELLDLLPAEQMAARLAQELEAQGFIKQDGELVRSAEGVTIRIDPASGAVCVESEVARDLKLEGSKSGWADEDFGTRGRSKAEAALRKELQRELAQQADQQSGNLDSRTRMRYALVTRHLPLQLRPQP